MYYNYLSLEADFATLMVSALMIFLRVKVSAVAATKKPLDAAEVAVMSDWKDDNNKKESLWWFFPGGRYASAFLPNSFGKTLV